jgi:hypothetical protein
MQDTGQMCRTESVQAAKWNTKFTGHPVLALMLPAYS